MDTGVIQSNDTVDFSSQNKPDLVSFLIFFKFIPLFNILVVSRLIKQPDLYHCHLINI